jgi:hypothetical protein
VLNCDWGNSGVGRRVIPRKSRGLLAFVPGSVRVFPGWAVSASWAVSRGVFTRAERGWAAGFGPPGWVGVFHCSLGRSFWL